MATKTTTKSKADKTTEAPQAEATAPAETATPAKTSTPTATQTTAAPTPNTDLPPAPKQDDDVVVPDDFKEQDAPQSHPYITDAEPSLELNSVSIAGNVGSDPEIRYFETGSVKTTLSLAVRSFTNVPDWFAVELWDKQAEVAYNYAKKGSVVGIEGYLKIDTWQDSSTGATRSRPVIKCNRISLLARPPREYQAQGEQS